MTLSINDTKIAEKGLDIGQFLLMLTLYHKVDMDIIDTKTLLDSGFISPKYKIDSNTMEVVPTGSYLITNKGRDIITDILLESEKDLPTSNSIQELAKEMQNLFPKGKKAGTLFYWRDSTPVIVKKLQIFFKRYGNIPYDQILNATKKYVESYGDDTKLMQLLKYFIWKNKSDGSEDSALLNYIENYDEDETPHNNEGWTSTLN